ncbi:hypothetical protein FRC07_009282 [Ceratobasidium sp. 392]|nr:hypothetical protein FRC07_009282 [Ceratobasidium sp. 392]
MSDRSTSPTAGSIPELKCLLKELEKLLDQIFHGATSSLSTPSLVPHRIISLPLATPITQDKVPPPSYAVPNIVRLANRYLAESLKHKDEDNRLSEFFCVLWNTLLDSFLSEPSLVRMELVRALISGLQKVEPERDIKIDWQELPFLGQCVRENYNLPIDTTSFDPAQLLSPIMQDALAGIPPPPGASEDSIRLTQQRDRWLLLQQFLASLWAYHGRDEYALYALWALRDGLEDWPEPNSSPSSCCDSFESSPAYLALNVQAASIWIRIAGSLMYNETRVWGPNGNPDWPTCAGAPGRGGERWNGVDGYDSEHKRWEVWKDVLRLVIGWYREETCKGTCMIDRWAVGDFARVALRYMEVVESSAGRAASG